MNLQKLFDRITFGAVLALICAAFYVASRSFWAVPLHRAEIIILTILVFSATVWLLSSVLPLAIDLWQADKGYATGAVLALGVFLLGLEITISKIGFAWLLNQAVASHIGKNDSIVLALACGLSVFNLAAKWAFVTAVEGVRELRAEQAEDRAAAEADRKAAEKRAERRKARLEREIAREKAGLEPKKIKLKAV